MLELAAGKMLTTPAHLNHALANMMLFSQPGNTLESESMSISELHWCRALSVCFMPGDRNVAFANG